MPQMSPIMWNIMLMMTTATIMMNMTKLFFMTNLNTNKKNNKKKSKLNINWKW
uniref:ATP synthase F0 subunit 8 n=1 Tax=Lycorma delicatula TaxID=130591 RepID=A0A7U3QIA5_LYCDL|nr:ATP synthase F0 subunit 8 [Lycorma delicatula]QPN49089.1 ATP synthase F0 subunit 8 [Lycorma delicatula]QPN49102.1 ATP synthase F0 subunit 8 [Lycorma delicatula]QPN49115.1 ATP synthase F0 subunit 8 [Lycorma delicatula]QPN49128.1 ATP synthase F0 subunit 8 [Lycorma delicatula]